MNVQTLLARLRNQPVVTVSTQPAVASPGPWPVPTKNMEVECYKDPEVQYITTTMPEGPGVDQLNGILEVIPPLSLKFGPWLAGGAVRRIMQGRTIEDGDVDLFFNDAADWLKFEKHLMKFELVHKSARASTFLVQGIKVQIIKRRFYENLGTLFADFDFSVCQVATDGKQLAYTEVSRQDIDSQTLRIAAVGRISSITVVGRLMKYVNHGFMPEKGLFRIILESGLDSTQAHQIFEQERPQANYDHDAKVEEIMDAKVFNSDALRAAASRLGLELPSE